MCRCRSQVIASALLVLASAAVASAEPTFTYLSQDRSVWAMTFTRASQGSYLCDSADDPPDPICEGVTAIRTESSTDVGTFSALANLRSRSDYEANFAGVFSRVEQNSLLASGSISATISLSGQEDSFQNGNTIYSFWASGEATLSTSFSLDAPTELRFTSDLTSTEGYNADGSLYAESAFARLTFRDGATVFNTADDLPTPGPLVQQTDRTLLLPAGEYDFYALVTAYVPNSTHYHEPGRIDFDFALTIESAAVPEPNSSALMLAACVVGIGRCVCRRCKRRRVVA